MILAGVFVRAIWKGHISFGLVSVPVSLYPAEQRTDLQLHMIDSRNRARVRYERVNAETGEEVPWDQIVKAFEYDDGNYVVLDKEEMKKAAPEASKSVDITSFVDLDEIDPIYFDRPYFLEPGKKGDKGYALLRETLKETGKAGIAEVVIRTRQYVAAMIPRGDALLLILLRYQQELRDAGDLALPGSPEDLGVSEKELKMARTLVEAMESEWDPSEHHDEYRKRLMEWIESKIESGEIHRSPEAKEAAPAPEPINIMDALKKSVEGAKPAKKKTKSKKKAG
jgi:DNA end-binding protein Ku